MKDWMWRLYYKIPVIRELRQVRRELEGAWQFRQMATIATSVQALEALKAGNERYRDPKRLLVHGAQYWSQNLEDGMIAEIFRRIGTTGKTFLEIGAADGRMNNTTALLSAGWSGWWIDGHAEACASANAQLQKMPETSRRLKVQQAFVSPDNIKDLLAKLQVPDEVDLFSLDIDLNTYHLWAALTGFRPRVVVVEYNAAFPPEQAWIHPFHADETWDDTQAFGASLKAFELLGSRLGYSLVGCDVTGVNAFFVRNDLVGDSFAAPFTAENHHEPPRYFLVCRFGHESKFFVESAPLK
ncbi:MAG: hypothetical protein LV481_03495 [Methylacidiphilales bacterium]|nr:hypothetical protein [Candidatus Methylacidiphilales bacterium]